MCDLYEFRRLFCDESQDVRIYNSNSDDVYKVYEGPFDEMPEWLETVEVGTIDNIYKGNDGFIGINVALEGDERDDY